ncbi:MULTISPECIES: carbohydrate kinase family protein [Actinomadura]|uniref:PfkB family carbohydrate kinase n=1 Tax=Actinomadura livida TaxID=79909 RepID=A0A7W7IB88_9ACTN|nr:MULTISPECIES: sugar kinase [Actinomadura]MBB4773936.1 sugar/nucleoside kinase (ribokinase family) [Actinomadura catellatispora]TDB96659.1 sugar kinase [Actinomadura sp. 7K534]GGT86052.1 sugar kinase [Actinomadura livida]
MTRVVVVGDLMTDTVARAAFPLAKGSDTPAAVTTHGGGSGANVAAWLAVEGIDVAFVGRRGSDIAGRNRDMELMGYGVDARLVMDGERPTGTCVVMVTHKGDRTMLSDPGANGALLPEDIERCKDLFTQGTHLHLSGYSLINEGSRKAAIHTLDLARKAQMSVSVDGGSSSPLKRMGAEPFLEWTQGARLLVVNAKEAEILTGRDNPEQAAKVLTAWYPQVVIKTGEDGALWYTNGRPEPVTVGAEPIDKIVDGTGAGDAFVAGFLPPWLDGKQPADALTAGCRLSAQAMKHLGARPTLDVVDNQIN